MPSNTNLPPLKVAITGAAGQIAYSLLFMLASGQVFGPNQPVLLHLLDITRTTDVLSGVVMELNDCAFPLLSGIVATTDPLVAFKDIDWAIMLGAMPRKQGQDRKDLLKANVGIFKEQGSAIGEVAKKTVRVVVVGNPANTNALIAAKYAPSIPSTQFSALTRLDENRAISLLAHKANIKVDSIHNVCVWGNHSNTQFPCVEHAFVSGPQKLSVDKVLGPDAHKYLTGSFIESVSTRGSQVIKARLLSSAMSAAKATADHIQSWVHGTAPGMFVSMAVISDGLHYNVPADLMFSFPVFIENGKWRIVPDLPLSDFAALKLKATTAELEEEKEQALAHIEHREMKGIINGVAQIQLEEGSILTVENSLYTLTLERNIISMRAMRENGFSMYTFTNKDGKDCIGARKSNALQEIFVDDGDGLYQNVITSTGGFLTPTCTM